MTNYNIDCPDFMIGKCKDIKNCPYKYHIPCNDNYICINEYCTKGHGITLIKRELINKIYTEFYDNDYDESNIQCEYPLNCFSEDCLKAHYVNYQYRKVIRDIINNHNDDNKVIEIYNNFIKTQPTKQLSPKIFKPTIDVTSLAKTWVNVVSPESSPICVTKSELPPKINQENDNVELPPKINQDDNNIEIKLNTLSQEIKDTNIEINKAEEYLSNLRIEYNKKIVESEENLNNLYIKLNNIKKESKKLTDEFIKAI